MKIVLSSRKHHYVARAGIFLIVIALVAGMAGCVPTPKYNLTMAVAPGGNGTATDLTDASPYTEGKGVNIKAETAAGYQFISWTAPAGTFANANAAQTTFTMPAQHVTVTANFAEGFPEGNGTEEDPYHIANWHHLDDVRNYLNDHFILINNLDSTTVGYTGRTSPTANAGKGWQPIETSGHPFTGTFDGQGHEIRGLFIDRPDENRVGLFGDVDEGGIIENVGVVSANVTGHFYVGGLVAKNNDSTVRKCYSTGSVTGDLGVGGLVGWNSVDGTVINSHFTGSASGYPGYPFVGGLVGANSGSVTNSYSTGSVTGYTAAGGLVGMNQGTVSNSYSTGNVTGDEDVGGLVGKNQRTVSNSYATGNVTGYTAVGGLVGWNRGTVEENSYSTGNVTGDDCVGGLLGWNDGTVEESYSTGNVTGSYCVGGLVGKNQDTVTNSYATGNVTGYAAVGGLAGDNHDGTVEESYSTGNVTGYVAVGGLVGRNYYATVTNSYSTGNVTGYAVDVGGLVGKNYEGTVSNSFWDTETSGTEVSAGGTGKTTAEMQDIATFTDTETEGLDDPWDIVLIGDYVDETWYIDDGNDYPRLSWQSV